MMEYRQGQPSTSSRLVSPLGAEEPGELGKAVVIQSDRTKVT